jgi:hypothetical protein
MFQGFESVLVPDRIVGGKKLVSLKNWRLPKVEKYVGAMSDDERYG